MISITLPAGEPWFVLFGFHTPHIGITALCKAKQGSIDAPPNAGAQPLLEAGAT
jgi:hypothetical protein